jgi:ATP-binding cassette subfamily C protein
VRKDIQTARSQRDIFSLLRHFFKVYPSRTITVVALLSVAGLVEGISVLALLPIAQLALTNSQGQTALWINWALTRVGLTISLGSLLLFIVCGMAVKAALTLLAMKEVGYAVSRMMTDLRQSLIAALMEVRWSYFVSRPLGVFANAICAETIRAGVAYQQSARLAAAFIQAIVYGVATVIVSWKIALFAVIAGAAGAALFRKYVAVAHEAGARQTELMQSIAVRATDTLQGIKAIKAMGAEKSAIPLLDQEVRELDEAQKSQVWSAEFLRVMQEPLLVAFLAIGIYDAVEFGRETLPSLMVVAVLFYRLFNRFQSMQEIYQQIGVGASAYWAIYDLCDATGREAECKGSGLVLEDVTPAIDFSKVSFGYGNETVLRNISLHIRPGQFVVISGPSGGGKTTLLDIVSGLLMPSAGTVRIGGNDLSKLDLRSWRGKIGYIPQEMLLLHDTIFRNISLGDETISRSDAENALRAAGVWNVVASLPDGLDTVVGERGGRFSGGQRQRISLARALARKPKVLLLDEITASLDKDTEQEVCETLRALAGEITIIAISHQPSLFRVADCVLHLDHGVLQPAA